jgi:hypothetical protein
MASVDSMSHENREVWLLTKTYNPYLIMLSMSISFLGAHTTIQYSPSAFLVLTYWFFRLVCKTYVTAKIRKKVLWIALASFMFGGW